MIFNLKEEESENLTLLEMLLTLFNETMKLKQPSNIDLYYRFGERLPNKIRPVLVSFFSLQIKNDILIAKAYAEKSVRIVQKKLTTRENSFFLLCWCQEDE